MSPNSITSQVLSRITAGVGTFLLGVALSSSLTLLTDTTDLKLTEPSQVKPLEQESPTCFPGFSVPTKRTLNYFPAGLLGPNEWSDQFRAGWYAKHLLAMHEPSLFVTDDRGDERYRFLWLRSFHHPVAIRVERIGDQRLIITKELDGAGGYAPGKVIVETTRLLSDGESARLEFLLADACFWQMSAEHGLGGNDGAQWILEGQYAGRYHLVDRWSPQSGSYRKACEYLLQISGLGIDLSSQDVY